LASGQGVQKDSKLAEEYLRCAGMIDPVCGKEKYIGYSAFYCSLENKTYL